MFFPVSLRPDNTKFIEADLVVVTHGGIIVIEVKGHKGKIDNPRNSTWHQIYKDKHLEFQNPFDQNAYHIKTIDSLLKREKMFNLPLYNIVVFSSDNVKFRYKREGLCTASALNGIMLDISKNRFLTTPELKHTLFVLRKYARRKPVQKVKV